MRDGPYEDEKLISQIPQKSLVLLRSVSANWTDISRLHSFRFIQPTSQKLSERQINISQRKNMINIKRRKLLTADAESQTKYKMEKLN